MFCITIEAEELSFIIRMMLTIFSWNKTQNNMVLTKGIVQLNKKRMPRQKISSQLVLRMLNYPLSLETYVKNMLTSRSKVFET